MISGYTTNPGEFPSADVPALQTALDPKNAGCTFGSPRMFVYAKGLMTHFTFTHWVDSGTGVSPVIHGQDAHATVSQVPDLG